MFLLVSGRHVGAHPRGHQHGVSIQSSVNLGNLILGEVVYIAIIYHIPDSWINWTITIFSFDHMTDENRE